MYIYILLRESVCESVCESVRVFEYFSVSVCFSGALYFFLFPRFSFSVSLWFAAAHYRVGTPNTPVVMFKTLFLFLLSTFTLLLTRANLTVDEKAQMPKKKRPATRRKESAPKIAATQTTPPRLKRRAGRSWGEILKSQCQIII